MGNEYDKDLFNNQRKNFRKESWTLILDYILDLQPHYEVRYSVRKIILIIKTFSIH